MRGRISTCSTASSCPENSSHSLTGFSMTVATLTCGGGGPPGPGDCGLSQAARKNGVMNINRNWCGLLNLIFDSVTKIDWALHETPIVYLKSADNSDDSIINSCIIRKSILRSDNLLLVFWNSITLYNYTLSRIGKLCGRKCKCLWFF